MDVLLADLLTIGMCSGFFYSLYLGICNSGIFVAFYVTIL